MKLLRALLVLAALLGATQAAALPEHSLRKLPPVPNGAPMPDPFANVQLVIDDGTAEVAFGVGGLSARQFLWFNVIDSPRDFDLEEIWVLFPDDPQIVPGAPIELVVYRDLDDDPSAGTELLLSMDEVVQFADGDTFSVYTLPEPLDVREAETTLLGVINRFVVSGVSPPSQPAALDTADPQARSWVATWMGDPPEDPELPPDGDLFRIDLLQEGNWTIRGYGNSAITTDIPALDTFGLMLLALLLAGVGWRVLRSR